MSSFSKNLESLNILLLDDFTFTNSDDEINFLSKIETLKQNKINIEFLNKDLINIFLKIEFNDLNIEKLKKFNFDEFFKILKKEEKTKRDIKIYKNLLDFLSFEFGILQKNFVEKKSLINLESSSDFEYKIDPKIFEKKENFDYILDRDEKAKKYNVNIEFDYIEKSSKLTPNDFTLYFNKRLDYFTNILQNRVDVENLIKISDIKKPTNTIGRSEGKLFASNLLVTFIGLISDISITKNNHYIIEIEDKSSSIKCLINKDKFDLIKIIQNLCLDEGVGIVGKVSEDIVFVEQIITSSIKTDLEIKYLDEENYVGFISDLHIGAEVFVEEAFSKLIDFLKGDIKNEELLKIRKKLKYLFIAGDVIEGIGVYPNQGKDAKILSTNLQYNEAARLLSQVPKDICMIIIPGNHDTVRLSEPQPKLPYEKAYAIYNLENALILSNPCTVKLFEEDNSGLRFLMYHGGSFFYYANTNESLRKKGGAKTPEFIASYLLEKRHLAPSHGSTLYIPDSQRDPLVIEKNPDFFICGHTHKHSILNYKNCSIINCGCWVEMSEYQEKMGMFPDIGKFTIVNTKTRKIKVLNLYEENYRKNQKEQK